MISSEEALDALAAALLPRLEKLLRGTDATPIDQRSSPLGPRRHCAAVRARIAAGKPGASVVGRRFLLSPAALSDELAARGAVVRPKPAAKPDPLAELARRFPLQRSA